ncbi:hypothetical protein DFJ58DRAFT_722785 [Suillus subalutaceus]|uniref:uncharacterized protein n=1 Tax=Suillus subalutaceus TaxID=48586 RepID=UPI001B86F1FC|nr:uncharacterized protein DFJ58DRAFT_722785 [Suillus subalutaceus]KAG1871362.1 hypothetical protein DFJ58DRAFT_722785 [Suillus subalutaceus]
MAEWADVYKDREHKDPSRNRILIYKTMPNAAPNTVFPMAIRLQGLLRDFQVERFGNWTGQESDALKVVQHVTLSSGGHKKAWDSTIDSINLVCEYTSRCLHIPMQGTPYDKDLYLQKHAFIKRDEPLKLKDHILKAIDDLEGRFLCIQEPWIPQQPLHVGDLTETAKIMAMDSMLLTKGDFVDVGAELDFVTHRDQYARTILKCFLTCSYIVWIIPVGQVQSMNLDNKSAPQKCKATPPKMDRPTKKHHTMPGFDEV